MHGSQELPPDFRFRSFVDHLQLQTVERSLASALAPVNPATLVFTEVAAALHADHIDASQLTSDQVPSMAVHGGDRKTRQLPG